MEDGTYYLLQLSTSGQRESWKFEKKADARRAYRAIFEEFGHYEHEGKSNKTRNDDRVQLKVTAGSEGRPHGETGPFMPEAWFKIDAYPRIVDWANRHFEDEE